VLSNTRSTSIRTCEADAPAHGIWTIQTSIIAANEASLRVHEAVGFRLVGRRERIAQRDGVWHDTVLLERRLG
jgi:L-amino acid N-acyltransferase YncA